MMRKERQATLHTPGEELPLTLGDGWYYTSSHIEAYEDAPPVLVALWERLPEGKLPAWVPR